MFVQKRRVVRAYDKRVRKKSFSEGDLVWRTVFPLGEKNSRYGKWSPTWEGPYQIATTPSTPTKSPFKPQVLIDQEKTEPEKVDELWSKILEVSKHTKKGHYSCIQPNSTIIHNTPSLGDTLIDQPSMSLEIVEKSVEPSTDIPRASMPAAKIPVQEALFQEGNGTPFNLDLQGQEVYISPKDKDTIEIGNKDIDPPIPHISEVSKTQELPPTTEVLPIASQEVATTKTSMVSPSSVNEMCEPIDSKEGPSLSEHFKLEEFGSNLSESLTIAAYCQKEMKEKCDIMSQFANVSNELDTMGNNIHQLKDKLHQIDVEEAKLLAHLGQLREERKSLLAQKELINHNLANITYDEQGIKAMVSVAKADFLKNEERYNVFDNRWSYFTKLFMKFKSKIQEEPRAMLLDSLLSMTYRPMPFQLVEACGKPNMESHESLFERAKNQQNYWKELRYDPPLSHAHKGYSIYVDSDETKAKELMAAFAFLDIHILEEHVPYLNFLWASSTAAHYDPFWVDYEVSHDKVVSLHIKISSPSNRALIEICDYFQLCLYVATLSVHGKYRRQVRQPPAPPAAPQAPTITKSSPAPVLIPSPAPVLVPSPASVPIPPPTPTSAVAAV
ncbi:hypothetical protein RHSIM_Rhsim01G0158600 [Rhododendron simsii]|uniref:Uncharacterized protein n=1 Tax=Rhododendron simsii TaxID=118357 RepID=A0A834HI62_RHOSS|nr:hypothetical protein RHSIM_Rhsim01G0158600 [Rhododendron simsii]